MPKKTYIGIDNIAKQVKKMYIGVDGVAKKVKKAYIGINGYASPIFGGRKVTHKDTQMVLYDWSQYLASASNSEYAIFAGGGGYFSHNYSAYAFNKNLTLNNSITLGGQHSDDSEDGYGGREGLEGVNLNDYILFGGGRASNFIGTGVTGLFNASYILDIFNKDLSYQQSSLRTRTRDLASATISDKYALFAGGIHLINWGYHGSINTITVIDKDLQSSTTHLSSDRCKFTGTSLQNIAIFSGGSKGATENNSELNRNVIDIFDEDLKRTTIIPELSQSVVARKAASNNKFAVFFGSSNYIYLCSSDGTLTFNSVNPCTISRAIEDSTVISANNYIFVAGGQKGSQVSGPISNRVETIYEEAKIIDVYNEDLTQVTYDEDFNLNLSIGKIGLTSTTINNYLLFGGGYSQEKLTLSGGNYPADKFGHFKNLDIFTLE